MSGRPTVFAKDLDTLSLAQGTMSLQEVALMISHGSCLWGVAFL